MDSLFSMHRVPTANSMKIPRKIFLFVSVFAIIFAPFLLYRTVVENVYRPFNITIPRSNSMNESSLALYISHVASNHTHFSQSGGSKKRRKLSVLANSHFSTETAYLSGADPSKSRHVSHCHCNLTTFIQEVWSSCLSRKLKPQLVPIVTVFHHPPFADVVRPFCDGLWVEFGVFRGHTLGRIANWKSRYCGKESQPVYKFDTFESLPTKWKPGFETGVPNTVGSNTTVPVNTQLIKGLFIDTLPIFLRMMDAMTSSHNLVSFVHVDCDIYDGARDVLFLLQRRMVSGTIIIFDELFNYPGYEQHEIKALYEFLSGTRYRLIPLGSSTDIELKVTQEGINQQSFGFVVDSVE